MKHTQLVLLHELLLQRELYLVRLHLSLETFLVQTTTFLIRNSVLRGKLVPSFCNFLAQLLESDLFEFLQKFHSRVLEEDVVS